MNDDAQKIICSLQGVASGRLQLVRRWIDELEGDNQTKAYEYLKLVMSGEISSEEAVALLDRMHG